MNRLVSLDAAETTDGPHTPGSRSGARHRASAMPQARRSSAASNHTAGRLGEGEPRRDLTAHPRSESPRVSPADTRPLVSSPSPSRRPPTSSPKSVGFMGAGGSHLWPAGDATPRGPAGVHGGVPAGQMTLEDEAA